MSAYIIGGLVGFAIGVALQRIIIIFATNRVSPTVCDCFKWRKANQWRWEARAHAQRRRRNG